MFVKIKYLQMEYKDVQIYIKLLTKLLEKVAKENTRLNVKGEAFRAEFAKYVTLLEDTFYALYHFN